ncbi:MAG: hypothetical protein J6I45_04145, partial [Clostridia bacterium]|nr:hypothetical protein [Clostridia bacterium]
MTTKSKFLAAPYLLWMIIFIVVPLALIVVFAFTTTVYTDLEGNALTNEEFDELRIEYDNFYDIPEDELPYKEHTVFTLAHIMEVSNYVPVLLNSVWLAIIATAICLLIGYPLAYLISRMRYGFQKLMLMLVMLPMWMNFLLRTYAWMTLLERNGWINKLLGLVGIGPFDMINTQGAVVLGMV